MNFHKYGWLRTKWKWYSLQRKYECILWQNGSRWSTPIRHSTLTPIHLHTTCGFLRKMFYFKCKRTNADALSGARDVTGWQAYQCFRQKLETANIERCDRQHRFIPCSKCRTASPFTSDAWNRSQLTHARCSRPSTKYEYEMKKTETQFGIRWLLLAVWRHALRFTQSHPIAYYCFY